MGMNDTPVSERVHIGIFGRRNAGKSSLLNAIINQNLSVVSEEKGTTTDPVSKAMEIQPLGPVLLTDTPGLDDEGDLGRLRLEKSRDVFRKTDIVLMVFDGQEELTGIEHMFLEEAQKKKLAVISVVNKCEYLGKEDKEAWKQKLPGQQLLFVSAATGEGVLELKECLAAQRKEDSKKRLVGDLLEKGDMAVLVVPLDSAAPKGRLILPQQQVIRDALESGASLAVTRETELKETLSKLTEKPKLVITDSQVFETAARDTPEDVYLTSFSILMSRYKGDLEWQTEGASALERLKDQDKILIAEGCTHHRQCGDIGSVKLPQWMESYTGKKFEYTFTSGGQFPEDVSEYALIVHCGGCTLNEKEMQYRISKAKEQNVPITNYGVLISYMKGILDRSLEIFQTVSVKH